MEKIIAFNTLNEFRRESVSNLIEENTAEKIENEVKEYCKKHKRKVTYVAVGTVDGCLTATCILQSGQKAKRELTEGVCLSYSYNLDTQSGNFENITVKKAWDNKLIRADN